MAKIRVTNTKSSTIGGAALAGLREVSFNVQTSEKEFGSDGGGTETDITDVKVSGEATFEDCQTYNTALAAAEGNLVVVGRSEGGGTDRTFTAKNCKFSGAQINIPTAQDKGVGTYKLPFRCKPGSSDTPQSMVTNA
jgi:hypothetical protein